MGAQKILLDIPDEVFTRLEETIQRTVEESLCRHADKLMAEPMLLTRQDVTRQLKITLPTLRKLELDGKLIPQRAGRRVLFRQETVDTFLRARTL